ncbi:MAG: hypothetical protein JO099_13310, partial [Acidobacteriia bacterium]|nr:hypothetical protein [Terriglobia bacterium]
MRGQFGVEWATQPGNRAEPRVAMRSVRYLTARTAAAVAVGGLYLWFAGLAGVNQRFAWNSGLDEYYGLRGHPAPEGSFGVEGYYDLLGRAFVAGHLRLPVEPSPKLLALPDPWSDKINRPYRLLDTVLYGGHYYLYHGPTPVLLLFAPWYGITRHDFPENFAVFLFSFAAYLFSAVLFTRVIGSLSIELPLWLYTLVVVVLGLCQSVPFLLHRAKVYEVAIACGYFCLSSGFYFLFRVLSDSRKNTFHAALAGLSFGLAVGCRPHLAAAAAGGLFALLVLRETPKTGIWRRILRPEVLAFTLPVVLCGLALAAYNFARFGNPFEFGIRYLLGEDAYRNFHFTGSLLRGFYYLLICPPDLVPEFPFVRMAMRPYAEYNLLPSGYFL